MPPYYIAVTGLHRPLSEPDLHLSISKEFIDTRNALGLKCRFHDLRHYNASIMLALNVPDKYAMERMGYSTPATLKKVYQHTMTGKRAEVNDMINGHMAAAFLSK